MRRPGDLERIDGIILPGGESTVIDKLLRAFEVFEPLQARLRGGLIGPNGAGKSTVIDAITGRRRLTRGRVHLGGEDVSELGAVERRKRGLSRSFQRTSIFGKMKGRQQVERASYKLGVAESGADADAVLKELDLYALSNATAEDLGYGEQRRLDLALALVCLLYTSRCV